MDTKKATLTAVNRAVKSEIYDQLRAALTRPIRSTSSKSWVQDFIEKMLLAAKQTPNSPLGQMIAKQLLTENILDKLDAETDRYLARDKDFLEYRLLKTLYDKQRGVFLDTDRFKIILGSRRIGKTELAARLLLKDVIERNRHAIFISLKFENAIRQCFPIVVRLAHELNFPIERVDKANGTITFSNGSDILFKGNSNKIEADKLQGYKFSCIVIDEIQTQVGVKHLINDILRPAMADYTDSTLTCLGTPPRIKGTVAQDIWENYKGWKKYTWTLFDNPYITDPDGLLSQICQEKGLTIQAPFIQREFYGQMVVDIEAQVYKDYTTYDTIPDGFIPTDVAIGVDFGWSDYNAFITLAYSRLTGKAYVTEERKFNKASVSAIVDVAREVYNNAMTFAQERNPQFEATKCMMYADTSDQSVSFELSQTYHIPVANCYKHDKKLAIQQLADWTRSGIIQIPVQGVLVDEFEKIVYKRDDQDNILSDIDDDLFHPDAADALLYASRQFAYDNNLDTGGESTNKKQIEESRVSTLPTWLTIPGAEDE